VIIEFENCDIEHLQDQVAARHGFTISTHKLELYGRCKSCKR
jgi:Fur family ferric uptake transcriptional regulator